MVTRELEFERTKGISSQAATQIVRTAGQYQSSVLINCGSKTVNAKSLMGILSMGTGIRGIVRVTADGRDETAAVDAIASALTSALAP